MLDAKLIKAGLSPASSGRITKLITTWVRSSGEEWTVQRLKLIKAWYLHRLAGQSYELPFVSFTGSLPSGPLKAIFRLKKPRKVLDALMVYTAFIARKVTASQQKKFFGSMALPDINLPYVPLFSLALSELKRPQDFEELTYHFYPFSGTKSVPGRSTQGKSVKNLASSLINDASTTVFWDFLDDSECEYVISHFFDNLYPVLLKVPENVEDEFVGKISVLQERGFKARFIANPRLCFQLPTISLWKHLSYILNNSPWSCTKDQKSGATWSQKKIQEGNRLWSIDLSDATNVVTKKLVMRLLSAFDEVPTQHIRYFLKLCDGKWYSKFRGTCVFTRGIPLGLYPSFPAFSLALGCLLRSIELCVGKKDTFRCLGDDIVISDDQVARVFLGWCKRLDIPISENKSIKGGSIAEFAGYVITKDSIIQPTKIVHKRPTNLFFYLSRDLDVQRAKTPTEFIAFVYTRILGQSNTLGLSLKDRGAMLHGVLGNITEDFISIVSHRDRSTLNQVIQEFHSRFPDYIKSCKRGDLVIEDFLPQCLQGYEYSRIENTLLRLTSSLVTCPNLVPSDWLSQPDVSEEAASLRISKRILNTYNPTPLSDAEWKKYVKDVVRKAIANQISIRNLSKATVEGRISERCLQILST